LRARQADDRLGRGVRFADGGRSKDALSNAEYGRSTGCWNAEYGLLG
jgi:hypothetical protein